MDLDAEQKAYLNSIYFDPAHPSSFGGIDKIYRTIKDEGRFRITYRQLKKWLRGQETYTLHRTARRHYPTRSIIVSGLGKQADADLMDMQALYKENDGIHFILLYIDDFSRKIWTHPLKNKTGSEVVKAFKMIYQQGGKCEKLRTDRGTEFLNKQLKHFLKKEGVHHFVSEKPSTKASMAERGIRTIKLKLYKYMNQYQTHRYIEALPKITSAYNHTYHRTIKMPPSKVTYANQSQVWMNIHRKKKIPKQEKLSVKIGEWVRISNLAGVFSKEFYQQYSGEIFQVVARSRKQGRPAYILQDYAGEAITGSFYPEEIQVIEVPENAVYRVEKIIRSRKYKTSTSVDGI